MHHMKLERTRISRRRIKWSGWKWKMKVPQVEILMMMRRTHLSRKSGETYDVVIYLFY
jgi:hypothetical protein